jgi:hypothetical protein
MDLLHHFYCYLSLNEVMFAPSYEWWWLMNHIYHIMRIRDLRVRTKICCYHRYPTWRAEDESTSEIGVCLKSKCQRPKVPHRCWDDSNTWSLSEYSVKHLRVRGGFRGFYYGLTLRQSELVMLVHEERRRQPTTTTSIDGKGPRCRGPRPRGALYVLGSAFIFSDVRDSTGKAEPLAIILTLGGSTPRFQVCSSPIDSQSYNTASNNIVIRKQK